MSPVRVLRLIARLNVGGPAKHCLYLMDLDKHGFHTLLGFGDVPRGEETLEQLFPAKKTLKLRRLRRSISMLDDFIMIFGIFSIMMRFKPGIIHTHTAKAGFCGRAASVLYRLCTLVPGLGFPRKVKVFHTFHGHTFHGYFGPVLTTLIILIEKILGRFFSHKIITLSNELFDDLTKKYKIIPPSKCKIIRLGVDTEKYDPEKLKSVRGSMRREFGIPDDTFIVALVSRITAIKNPKMFIDVCARYKERYGTEGRSKVIFMLVGKGTDEYEVQLREYMKQKNVYDDFLMVGNRYDLERFYSDINLCALTSLNEGTPLSFLEAFAAKVPCISTAVGGVPDLFGADCERGILIKNFSVDDYVEAIYGICSGKDTPLSMVENAFKYVRANHSRERLVEEIRSLYMT